MGRPGSHRRTCLIIWRAQSVRVRGAAWYPKPHATFSDTIASIRRWLWRHEHFSTSLHEPDVIKIPQLLLDRFIDALCYAV
jgi:hypothetical protein